jgi:uncharacterized protein (TIGR03437 family)
MTATRALLGLTAVFIAAGPRLAAYERMSYNGLALSRSPTVPFVAGPTVAAGLKNADGAVIITPESDPIAALKAATAAWNSVSGTSINFQFTVSSTAVNVQRTDGINVFSFADDAATRSALESAVAATMVMYTGNGVIADTDILFNPELTFSTIPTLDSYDLQSVATHELGHALGADHSYLTAATMFAFSDTETVWQRHLSSDDMAFAAAAYPKDLSKYGGVAGKVTYASGTPVSGALVLICPPSAGVIVGVTTQTDGTYLARGLPPGEYLVFAYPVAPYLGGDDTGAGAYDVPDWQPTFYGSGGEPRTIPVSGGQNASVDLTVPNGSAQFVVNDAMVSNSASFTGVLPADHASEIFVAAKGLPATVLPEDILIYGSGVTLQADSILTLPASVAGEPGYLWFTVDVGPHADWSEAVLALSSSGFVAPMGSFRVQPSGPQFPPHGVVSGASFYGGALAPGEIVSLFGTGIGPNEPAHGAFDATGKLATSVGGVSVEFDGRPAPLFYVGEGQINAQVPFEVSGHASTLVRVQFQDAAAQAILPVAAARPEIFGTRDQVCVYDEHGTANDFEHPAARGSVIVAYGTGQGLVRPALATGAPGSADPLNRAAVTARIGGVAANVEFAGLTPGLVGLLQLNIKVPDSAPTGWTTLELTCNGVSNKMPVNIVVQ